MQTSTLGRTGLRTSRIGLGLAALGRPGYINPGRGEDLGPDRGAERMRAAAYAVLDVAAEAAIRYLDAARSYGRAEEFLAGWLRERDIPPGHFTIGSKWGYTYTADWRVDAEVHEVKDHRREVLERQWGESRERLGSFLGLYQIHSATLDSGVLDDADVLGRLVRLRAEHGVAIGLSLSGPAQAETLRRAADVEAEGSRVFDTVQATWNLLERSADDALAAARKAGIGVIVKEALANGRLAGRDAEPTFRDRLALLEREARLRETTPDALALAAVLARPWADVVLSGAATPEQLRANLGAITVAWDDDAEDRLRALVEPPAEYWQRRAALDWN
jgi:aryl-alcohol dehydrogenase-like predicted oxidoreductase